EEGGGGTAGETAGGTAPGLPQARRAARTRPRRQPATTQRWLRRWLQQWWLQRSPFWRSEAAQSLSCGGARSHYTHKRINRWMVTKVWTQTVCALVPASEVRHPFGNSSTNFGSKGALATL